MKYFLDTEFIAHSTRLDGTTASIDLISIGIVAESGSELYLINRDCDFSRADRFVQENVLPHLPPRPKNQRLSQEEIDNGWRSKGQLVRQVAHFLGCEELEKTSADLDYTIDLSAPLEHHERYGYRLNDGVEKPEFWCWYGAYDWTLFGQLFGALSSLPEGFPLYFNELKQYSMRLGDIKVERDKQGVAHRAIDDARWNRQTYDYLKQIDEQRQAI